MEEMNTGGRRRILWITASLILVCAIAVTAIASGVLSRSEIGADLTIDLIPEDGNQSVSVHPLQASDTADYALHTLGTSSAAGVSPLEYSIYDQYDVVYGTDTQVDIFKVTYENDQQQITVAGKEGQKVIAPGTENNYTFYLRNNYDGYLDYKVELEAFFTGLDGQEKVIPVEVRFDGRYDWLAGSDAEWEPVLNLNSVEESGVIPMYGGVNYTLYWQWPFESGDDEWDTWLGIQSSDVTLTIRIITYATYHMPEEAILAPIPDLLNGEDHMAYLYGYPDGTIRPEADITRAEVAAIFYRLLKDEVREANTTDDHDYSDITPDDWYITEVATMSKLGILRGYPDGTFRGDDTITRAEMAAILARLSGQEISTEGETKFSDIQGHWAEGEIMTIEDFNWIVGYTDGTFRPDDPISRAETATMINRVLHRVPELLSDLAREGMRVWPDNADTSKWYYIAIQEATHDHTFRRLIGTREQWSVILNQDAYTTAEVM